VSRTDAHRPYRARLTGPPHAVELHDHRTGPCDLPTLAQWRHMLSSDRRHWLLYSTLRCTWTLSSEQQHLCGCAMCTGRFDRQQDRRRTRRQATRDIHDQLTEDNYPEDFPENLPRP
jgi:hypothetical protein